jgi:hypothetical protein
MLVTSCRWAAFPDVDTATLVYRYGRVMLPGHSTTSVLTPISARGYWVLIRFPTHDGGATSTDQPRRVSSRSATARLTALAEPESTPTAEAVSEDGEVADWGVDDDAGGDEPGAATADAAREVEEVVIDVDTLAARFLTLTNRKARREALDADELGFLTTMRRDRSDVVERALALEAAAAEGGA